MIGTKTSTAALTAAPIAPDDPSTLAMAAEIFSRNIIDPSAPRIGFFRAVFLISESASRMRRIAGWERHPKAPFRKRGAKVHRWFVSWLMQSFPAHGNSAYRFQKLVLKRALLELAELRDRIFGNGPAPDQIKSTAGVTKNSSSRMPTDPTRWARAPGYLKGPRIGAFYTSLSPKKTGFTQDAEYNYSSV